MSALNSDKVPGQLAMEFGATVGQKPTMEKAAAEDNEPTIERGV